MSSREKRRSGASPRSRRTAVRPATAGGRQFPMVPVVAVIGVAAVVGLIAYLIWQVGQPGQNRLEGAAAVEADPAPDLPGEFVNLPEIYDGFYGNPDGNSTAEHVSRPVDYAAVQELPPTGGPHWGSGGCAISPEDSPPFCGPAPWGIYREAWDAEVLVHNMEHGGAVVWYNTTDQAVIDDLEDLVENYLDDDEILVLAPFPDMEDESVAVTSWGRRDIMPVSEYDRERVEEFLDVHICRFNPEDLPGC